MEERRPRKKPIGAKHRATEGPKRRRRARPLGLGEMDQRNFPFIAIVNGETMIVDRIGQRITFTPWI